MVDHTHLKYLQKINCALLIDYNQSLATPIRVNPLAQWLAHWTCTKASQFYSKSGCRNIFRYIYALYLLRLLCLKTIFRDKSFLIESADVLMQFHITVCQEHDMT